MAADKVLKALSDAWPGGCDVLHIHNPTLAKNRQFLQIIKRLQQSGANLFLQIHDFAEDGRPGAYFKEDYPADCHYGVINGRDFRILVEAGLDVSGLHHIPNAVHFLPVDGRQRPKPLVIYPVRAIRRKNLGEVILLSMFLKNDRRIAITQPPNSTPDMASYIDWKAYVKKNRLHVDFDAGQNVEFSLLVGVSESMVTTSITEGFGFSFLEPWTAGKLLWGRRLDDICEDFDGKGICLNSLYNRIDVPLNWMDTDAFARSWRTAVFSAADAYDYNVTPDVVDCFVARLTHGASVDFGLLSERFQRQILSHLLSEPTAKADLAALNPWLSQPGVVPNASAMIENNRRAVTRHYNPERYGQQLLKIYRQVVHHPVRHRIDKRVLLDAFFDLDRFPLLKWGAYDG
ncbi:MAG: hypothetical protein HGJ94_20695 [Desulfosarcina sp.]|nr:hypothetical protein [Desulfosarcina sp.]